MKKLLLCIGIIGTLVIGASTFDEINFSLNTNTVQATLVSLRLNTATLELEDGSTKTYYKDVIHEINNCRVGDTIIVTKIDANGWGKNKENRLVDVFN